MLFSEMEIERAVRFRLAQLDTNSALPVVLMPLDPETGEESTLFQAAQRMAKSATG